MIDEKALDAAQDRITALIIEEFRKLRVQVREQTEYIKRLELSLDEYE